MTKDRGFPKNTTEESASLAEPNTRLADFLFEAGMLKKTPRTGFQFLGSGAENVAEHSFRTALIGYVLASMAGADAGRTTLLCLFHDFHEARTGDLNYVNSMYVTSRERDAMKDAVHGTPIAKEVMSLWDERDAKQGLEAALACDADQIDLILNLVEQRSLGNPYAQDWIDNALLRLGTKEGKDLARAVCEADPSRWWFAGHDRSWWVHKGKK